MDKVRSLNQKIKNLGINVVAEASGLNKSTISRYVSHERAYSLENFEKVQLAVQSIERKSLRGRTSAHEATQRVVAGEDWRISYFDFVDSLLATKSELLIRLMARRLLNLETNHGVSNSRLNWAQSGGWI